MFKKLFGFLSAVVLITLLFAAVVSAEESEHNGYIVKMKTGEFRLAAYSDELSEAENYGDGYYVVEDYETAMKLSDIAEYVEPNYVIKLHGAYDYTNVLKNNYAINFTGVNSFWGFGCFGENVLVGIIDSGCNSHTNLNGAVVTGYNMVTDDEDEIHNVSDTNGHGTMVAGFISARLSNKYIVGMAHHAKVLPIKVFEGDTSSDVMGMKRGLELAIEDGCKVINMSFGTPTDSLTMRNAIKYAEDMGVVVVASVGNKQTSSEVPVIQYPAGYETVIGVGAVDSSGNVAAFSYHNDSVYVVAPGVGVYSTYFTGNKTGTGSGTSYASPIVAGIIADILSVNPELTPAQIRAILKDTATPKGNAEGEDRNDYYGYGIVNCDAIMEYLLQGKEYFVSPVDSFTATPEVTVWKADSADDYIGLWTEDGEVVDIVEDTTDNIKVFSYPLGSYESLKFMLWENLDNIRPLYKSRTITAE